jgi:hypothetical protein
MPRLRCPDGHPINLSSIPNPNGYILIRERGIETIVDELTDACEKRAAERTFVENAFASLSSRNPDIMQVYECPTCGRLAVFDVASDDVPLAWYQVESTSVDV